MQIPEDVKYSKEHEWIRIEGDVATIGITDYAQEQLGDVVMVELPAEGSPAIKNEAFGVVESVKSVSDIFAPVTGTILQINDPLIASPGVVNEDCYGEGWLVKVKMSQPGDVNDLMDQVAYRTYLDQEA